jgi:hypothetical protein
MRREGRPPVGHPQRATAAAEFSAGVGSALVDHIDGYKDLLRQAVAWMTERGFEPVPKLVIGDPCPVHRNGGQRDRGRSGGRGPRAQRTSCPDGGPVRPKSYLSDHVGCSILIACNPTSDEAFGSLDAKIP